MAKQVYLFFDICIRVLRDGTECDGTEFFYHVQNKWGFLGKILYSSENFVFCTIMVLILVRGNKMKKSKFWGHSRIFITNF